MRRSSAVVFAAILSIASGSALAGDRITGKMFSTRSEVLGRHGMVCTSQPLATQAGLEMLRRGGSAVDAAIAANAVLCVVEPVSCGVGGDLFAIAWDAQNKKLAGLNGSGRSPRSLTLDEFKKRGVRTIPSRGVLPITVPGCVDAWCTMHARFGKLPLTEVLAPAIQIAREGFPVTELIAYYWANGVTALREYPNFVEQFTVDGRAPKTGEIFANPNLAALLEKIAAGGRDAFYTGDVARAIENTVKRQGGFLTAEDLASHKSEWVDPVSTNYRGFDVWELPPNGQGIAVLQMLNVLEGYDLRSMGFGSVDHVHLFLEAKKLAFEDRAKFYADPEFAKVPVNELISKDYAAKRRALVEMGRAARAIEPGNPALERGDTICLTTADDAGNMVSWIQSNYRGMGSGVCPDGLGFIIQDRGELFDLTEGRANTFAPGKRPFHTIIPGFVTKEGAPYLAFAVMGGATQPQGHVQVLINHIDFGMNVQEAGDAPRILHNGSSEPTGERMLDGGSVSLESGFAPEVVRGLIARGHKIALTVGDYGGYQAIRVDAKTRVYFGASEGRKDGAASGY